jgi:hypothetical protein
MADMTVAAAADHLCAMSEEALLSGLVMMFSGAIGLEKLGQPVPESNLSSELYRSSPQPAQR